MKGVLVTAVHCTVENSVTRTDSTIFVSVGDTSDQKIEDTEHVVVAILRNRPTEQNQYLEPSEK